MSASEGSSDPNDWGNLSEELIEEFSKSIPISKFHRYLVRPDGTVHFGFLGENGEHYAFKSSYITAHNVVLEFGNLVAMALASSDTPPPRLSFPFNTTFVLTTMPIGGDQTGHVTFEFYTDCNQKFVTTIMPGLAADMASSISSTLSSMANPPPIVDFTQGRSKLRGKPPKLGQDTVTYFGQEYRRDILEIVGVVMIRANILEIALVRLLAAIADLALPRAEALFYSSQNNKARIDMMRALLPSAGISESQQDLVKIQLTKVLGIAQRRNTLVHGEWEFKNDKFVVREKRPLSQKSQDPIESHASIKRLASDYHDVSLAVSALAESIPMQRAFERKSPKQ